MVVCCTIVTKAVLPEPKSSAALIKNFWINKTFSTNYEIVICGDSRIYRGISAAEITKNTSEKLSAINIGYSSAGLSHDYLDFAVSKLKTRGKKILIIGITPHSLTYEASKNEHLKSFTKVKWIEKTKSLHMYSLLSFFEPYKLKELIWPINDNYIQSFKSDGWVASDYVNPDSTKALASYIKTFNSYKVDSVVTKSFLDKVSNLKNDDIRIIAFRPPSTMAMRELEDSLSGFNENYLKNELSKNNIVWVSFQDKDYVSYDGSHLVKISAIRLSEELAYAIDTLIY